MLEQFSNIIVAVIVGLLAPPIAKFFEFKFAIKKSQLNERKELIQWCIAYATENTHFYKNKEFITGTFPRIRPDLSEQLAREIEEIAEEKSRKSLDDEAIEQIRKKFIDELVKLERKM